VSEAEEVDRFWAGKKVWRYAASEGVLVFKLFFSITFVIGTIGWIFRTETPFFSWIARILALAVSFGLVFSIPFVFWSRWSSWKNHKAAQK
jgi:membrane protein YdbS with pleckstrin-like domain